MTKGAVTLPLMETAKALAIVITAIVGNGFVNGSSEPNERMAILETKVKSFEVVMPEIVQALHKIDKKQDSILVVISMEQK